MLRRLKSTESTEEEDLNEPIKFSTSKAATWDSRRLYMTPYGLGELEPRPWYERFYLPGCIFLFLVYFCILREESDIDMKIGADLADIMDDFKTKELEACIQIFKNEGRNTKHLEEKLSKSKELNKEIEELGK